MAIIREITMFMRNAATLAVLGTVSAAVSTPAPRSGGISGHSGKQGRICTECHGGGVVPTVTLSGPATLQAGATGRYTLHISGGQQIAGGLNVAADDGSFAPADGETRILGGEITPAKLIAIGEVARDFDLYTKITGGQRIDLFGAQKSDLPAIWGRLIEAGFETGHAYGKSLRTVKSCVGSTWCRFGVQDSVGVAIRLEQRYRGIRAPHKLKSAVSGCVRRTWTGTARRTSCGPARTTRACF